MSRADWGEKIAQDKTKSLILYMSLSQNRSRVLAVSSNWRGRQCQCFVKDYCKELISARVPRQGALFPAPLDGGGDVHCFAIFGNRAAGKLDAAVFQAFDNIVV